MKVLGCGIDIEETDRFNKHYFDKGKLSDLIYDLFTSREIENFSLFGKQAFLKGFCFKEAFYKAFNSDYYDWKDVEIIFTAEQEFDLFFSVKLESLLKEHLAGNIVADFSETADYVLFKVIITTL
ncbi:MAG: 4'-phosphopantetheinyl transferase superfamily protein [Bacteroidales bacterium]|jgi:phosphopantetheine--protein transferase-like protein|nr:4'-phosphopantetheinyl transferase superfamily protein [Bacteroidales bacterium]